jgi:hypothetical protein
MVTTHAILLDHPRVRVAALAVLYRLAAVDQAFAVFMRSCHRPAFARSGEFVFARISAEEREEIAQAM